MIRAVASSLALALVCACAGSRPPSVAPLCGTWTEPAPGTRYESWSRAGQGLVGEGGDILATGELVATEQLQLRAERRGHVYLAQPGQAIPTKFSPIDPAQARFGTRAPATATHWSWANYDHDFPQEIHYVLLDNGRLQISIGGPKGSGGQGMGWTFVRAAACAELEPPR